MTSVNTTHHYVTLVQHKVIAYFVNVTIFVRLLTQQRCLQNSCAELILKWQYVDLPKKTKRIQVCNYVCDKVIYLSTSMI